ncbi:MAG: hypothetical protein OYH76_02490 [Defluviicoccus sp.]|nr:hypothetical protein [Defluviicoccus sp.]MDE0274735.1 hypothetical protein [Defluviicoccus sp.]
MNRTLLLAILLGGLLLAAAVAAVWMWDIAGDVPIGIVGLLAMAAGVIASLALGIGLMRLVYRSEREDDE